MERAASKVLGIIELLESILIHLPCKDVLLAQRVSKTWKATIVGSLAIQTALCFLPAQEVGGHSSSRETDVAIVTRSGLAVGYSPPRHSFASIMKARFSHQVTVDKSPSASYFNISVTTSGEICLNPLFTKLFPHRPYDTRNFDYHHSKLVYDTVTPSWKKMYLVQPPANRVSLHWSSTYPEIIPGKPVHPAVLEILTEEEAHRSNQVNLSGCRCKVENESGVTIADFVDYVMQKWNDGEGCEHRFGITVN